MGVEPDEAAIAAMQAGIKAQIASVPAFAIAFQREIEAAATATAAAAATEGGEDGDGADPSRKVAVKKGQTLKQLTESLSKQQLEEANDVFRLFDLDGKGEIGARELAFALAQLGQHPSPEELDAMVAEFDDDGDGAINLEEFLVMMDTLGWADVEISERDVRRLQISYYGQASIVRWLQDDSNDGTGNLSGDATAPSVPSLTRTCRKIALTRSLERLIYLCIFVAAVISGMQSYKVDSEYEHATWANVADGIILVVFCCEIVTKLLAENRHFLQHFFVDPWNVFDTVICAALIATTIARLGSEVAPFRLIRLLRAVRLLRTVRLFPN
eukprot:COSAG05_NODE_838_length_7045_cov_19.123956_5_plen_327_part_01